MIRVMIRTREKYVFIEANKWLHEKIRLPFEIADLRFHSAAKPQNSTAEWSPERTGELRRFHDRRSRPPFDTEIIKLTSSKRRSVVTDRNCRNKPEPSGLKWRF